MHPPQRGKETQPVQPLVRQDIAVVPLLVLLPLIESSGGVGGTTPGSLLRLLGPTALESAAGLGMLLLGGRFVLRKIFEVGGWHADPGSLCGAGLPVRLRLDGDRTSPSSCAGAITPVLFAWNVQW